MTRPSIRIERCTAETIPEYVSVTDKTFDTPAAHESQSFSSIFFPNGVTPAISDWMLAQHLFSVKDTEHDFYFLARDASSFNDNGKAIGAARWRFCPATGSDAAPAAAEATPQPEVPEGVLIERFDAFRAAQSRGQDRCVRPGAYLYLKVVAVLPEFQRRGVGAELVRWGTRWADERGIKCYLEASAVGRGLYEKFGFESKGELDWDPSRFEGVNDQFSSVYMVREPRTLST